MDSEPPPSAPHDPDTPLPGDPRRQAHLTLRAYHYQLWLTLLAWLRLREGECLWVEQSEDYDITAATGSAAVQVSHSAHRVTLRDRKIREAIANFWRLRQHPATDAVRLEFITRGEAGVEADEPFGAGMPGLRVWQRAATDLSAAEQLLGFLCSEGEAYPPELREYFGRLTAATAQCEIFAAVTFATGAGDSSAVIEAIDLELRKLAADLGIESEAAIRERDKLYGRIRDVAEKRATNKLTRSDLGAAFRTATAVVLRADFEQMMRQFADAPAMLRALLGSTLPPATALAASEPLLREPLPLPPEFLPRETVVAALQSQVRITGILFLRGSANTGKTTLARSLAAAGPGVWRWLSMAGVRGDGALLQLRMLAEHLTANAGIGQVIIDDLDLSAEAHPQMAEALGRIALLIDQRGGRLLVTTQAMPTSRLLDVCAAPEGAVLKVPKFSAAEVHALAGKLGCPDGEKREGWGAGCESAQPWTSSACARGASRCPTRWVAGTA